MKAFFRVALLPALFILCLPGFARAQTAVFFNGSTNYDSSLSFSGLTYPGDSTAVQFHADGGTYSLSLGGSIGAAKTLQFTNATATQGGTYNFDLGGGSLDIGTTGGSTSNTTFEVAGGTTVNFTSSTGNGAINVGDGNTSIGDLNGRGTLSLSNVTLNFDEYNDLNNLGGDVFIGGDGIGSLALTGTSVLQNSDLFSPTDAAANPNVYGVLVGANITAGSSGASGTLSIGTGSSLILGVNGFLDVGGIAHYVGAASGGTVGGTGVVNNAGTITLTDGATAVLGTFTGGSGTINTSGTINLTSSDLLVGTVAGATGALNETGGAIYVTGTAANKSYLIIGENGPGTFTQSGGTLTVDANSSFLVGSDTTTTTAGTGVYNQTGGSATFSSTVDVGTNSGTGTSSINQSGGTSTYTTLVLGGATGQGVVTLRGGSMDITTALTISGKTSSFTLDGGSLEIDPNVISDSTKFFIKSGTFEPTAHGTLAYAADLDGAFTLDTTKTAVNYTGNISGNGSINVTGGGTLTLNPTGVNTFTGGAGVFDGSTLVATLGTSLPTTGPLFVDAGGLADLTVTGGDATLTGTISGAGNVQFENMGNKVTLSGLVDSTGTISTEGTGLLTVDQGVFNNLAAGGALTVAGPVMVTGDLAALTGAVTVNTGADLFAKSITAPSVINNGQLAVEGPLGSMLSISGNLVSPGTLVIRADSATSDKIGVGANADLTGGKLKVFASGTATYKVLTSKMLTGLPTVVSSPLLTVTASETATVLSISTVQNPLLPFAQSPNQKAVAQGIDGAINGTIAPGLNAPLSALDSILDPSQVNSAVSSFLDQLSPERIIYGPQIAVENSTFFIQSLDSNLAAIRSGSSGLDTHGLSLATPDMSGSLGRSLLAYYAPAPNGINYYSTEGDDATSGVGQSGSVSDSATSAPVAPKPMSSREYHYYTSKVPNDQVEGSRFNEFLTGNVVLANLNQNAGSGNSAPEKANYTNGNATAGVSFRINPHLAAGVDFNYSHTHAETDANGSKTDVDTYSPGIFATFFEKGFFLNGIFSYGYNNYSDSRVLSLSGFNQTANSSPSGSQYVTDLDGGYDFHPLPGLTVTPSAGIQYVHVDIDSFTESGANPFDLSVNSQKADSERSRIGGTINYAIPAGVVVFLPNISAFYQHEFGDSAASLTSSFGELPQATAFTINGAGAGRDSALLGAGFDALVADRLVVYLHYFADVGNDEYFAQTVEGGFRAAF